MLEITALEKENLRAIVDMYPACQRANALNKNQIL